MRPLVIVMLACFGIFVLSACFIWSTPIFAVVSSVSLTICSSIASWFAIQKYRVYKHAMAEMRYQDAYLYADENDDVNAIKTFSYSRKVERKLRAEKFQQWLRMFSPIAICVISIVLIIVSINMCTN